MATLTTVLAIGLGACGVQPQDQDRPLASGDLAFTPRTEPTSSIPETVQTITTATTSSILPARYPLDVYFVDGDHLRPVRRDATEADIATAVDALRRGPTAAETSQGLRSAIPAGSMIADATTSSGTATVTLAPTFLTLSGSEQSLAIAQIVYTITIVPGIGQVLFVLNEQPLSVPRGDGQPSSGTVSRDDYTSLLTGQRAEPTLTAPATDLH